MTGSYIASVNGAVKAIIFAEDSLVLSLPEGCADDNPATSYPYSDIYGVSSHTSTEVVIHLFTDRRSSASNVTDAEPSLLDLRITFHDLPEAENNSEGFVREIKKRFVKASSPVEQSRHLHVFVNPFGGHGKGLSIWDEIVRPMFVKAGWAAGDTVEGGTQSQRTTFAVTVTNGVGHAERVAGSFIEAGKWTGRDVTLVSIGGDGLIHELVNGILAPLKSSESPLPTLILGVIPAGTGNAIATTLSITTPAQAAFRIITARSIIPLKVTSVHIGPAVADAKGIKWTDSTADVEIPPVVKYSVVVVSWGLHAQIVRQSESLRALGNQRFRIAAMKQLALNQQYPGKLYLQDGELLELSPLSSSPAEATFCPLTPDSNSSQTLFTSSNGPNTSTTKFSYFVSTKVSSLELGFKIAPHAHPSNPTTDLILCTSPDRSQVLDLLKGAGQNGNHTTLPFVKYVRAKGYTLLPTGGGRVKTDGMVEWVSSLVGSGGGRVVHDLCIDGEMVEVEDGKAVWISVVEGRLGDVFRVFA